MTSLNFRASEPHFVEHMAPIWHALDPEERGVFSINPTLHRWALEQHGIHATATTPNGTWLVASWGDLKRARPHGPVIYMEHGAGQTYDGQHSGSYIGGDRDGVVAVLVPGPHSYRAAVATYDGPVYAIGSPKMDRWQTPNTIHAPPTSDIVAVTWHWDCYLVPETQSAAMHYRSGLRQALNGRTVLGHSHPRGDRRMERLCDRNGWDYTDNLTRVFNEAAVLIADNTSALYEFATLGRPVIVCNAPQYRRDVHHGLRFWSHVPGVMVDNASELARTVRRHDLPLCDPAILADVYAVTDGTATARAVTALREVLT